jgi:hypothetical protein
MNTYTKREIEDLACSALNVACSFIQEQMNIKTGDLAGLFFTGEPQDIIESILQDYIRREIEFKELPID